MPFNNKRINNFAKDLLKDVLSSGQDISLFQNFLRSEINDEQAFILYYPEILKLITLFDEYKQIPSKNNYSSLLRQVQVFGFSQLWIDGILNKIGITALNEDEEKQLKKAIAQQKMEEKYVYEESTKKVTDEYENNGIKEKEKRKITLDKQVKKNEGEKVEHNTNAEAERKFRKEFSETGQIHKKQITEEKFCRKCGNRILKDIPFCSKCGASQETKECSNCKRNISQEAVFCPYCNSFCVSK
jgi:RNA polymerase subunit RPABC4/transcription elongation factor Spt4